MSHIEATETDMKKPRQGGRGEAAVTRLVQAMQRYSDARELGAMSDLKTRVWWMSVALTTQAVRDRIKTQTRRDGWRRLREGDRLALCPKFRGVRRAERELITIVDVLSVRREPLQAISASDVVAEGFPDWTPAEFVEFFCRTHRGVEPGSEITCIKWAYPRMCRTCGCTEYAACDGPAGPCGWESMYDDNTGICTACGLWAVDRASASDLWAVRRRSEMSYPPRRMKHMEHQRETSKVIRDDALPEEWDEFGDERDWDWQFDYE